MSVRLSKDAAKALGIETPKRSKYNAKRTEYNGRVYASRAEADRAINLDAMQRAGIVEWWEPQIPISIGESGIDKRYIVDFIVYGKHGLRAEDVKGRDTPSFRRHVRQWRKRGPMPLHVIRNGVVTEIITREE